MIHVQYMYKNGLSNDIWQMWFSRHPWIDFFGMWIYIIFSELWASEPSRYWHISSHAYRNTQVLLLTEQNKIVPTRTPSASLLDVPLVHGPDPVWSALQSQSHPVW